ncbi:MAG: hypothetical protein ACM3SR_00555 [Ignavibacteriales bacterium]
MEQLVATLAWPGVIPIIALVAILVFRVQISVLIGRTKKIGKGWIETFENQPAQPTEEKKGVEEFFKTFDNPLLVEGEQLIIKDLKDRNIETPADREKTLVRALASTNLILHFERLHGLI